MSDANLTAFEVAAKLRCEPATARRYMRAGRIEATKATGQWLASEAAVDAFLAEGSNRAQSANRRRRRRAS